MQNPAEIQKHGNQFPATVAPTTPQIIRNCKGAGRLHKPCCHYPRNKKGAVPRPADQQHIQTKHWEQSSICTSCPISFSAAAEKQHRGRASVTCGNPVMWKQNVLPECVARVPVSFWGFRGWGCVRQTLRNRSQLSACSRVRPIWPRLWRVLQKGSILDASNVA